MNGERRTAWAWLPWLGAAAAFVATLQTADDVLHVPMTTTPLVAAAAAVPLGLVTTLPALGWLLSAGTALAVSRAFEVTDGDPWPWPTVHGVVLLALLFATAFQPLPQTGRASGRVVAIALPAVATIATAFLFAFSVPDDLRAGWTVGAALVGVAGIVTARLRLLPAPPADAPVPPGDLPELLRGGLRRATTDWGPAPAITEPSPVAPWVRRFVPWLAAFVIFWTAIATIEASVAIHPLLVPVAGLAIALPAGLVDRRPLVGWRLATVLGIVLVLLGPPADGEYDGAWPVIFQWTWLATVFSVAVRYDRWTTICVWAVTVAAMTTGAGDNAGTSVTLIVAVTAIAVIGDLVRARRSTSRDLERQTELSELEKARRTVLEERSRLARDLHDVVAHHMSMVVVQAETAPYRLKDLPDDARAEFASISGSARQALDEIRGLLGVLRGTDDGLALTPQPGIAQLPDLVGGARRSGVAAQLTTTGAPPSDLSAAVGLSAYRIVQESLANAARHAPGAEVTVDVRYTEAAVELRIRNSPPRPDGVSTAAGNGVTRADGSGHGLPGTRERAGRAGDPADDGVSASRAGGTGGAAAGRADESGRGLPDSERADGIAGIGGTAADRTHAAGTNRATPADESGRGLPDSERADGTAGNGGTAADRAHAAGTNRATPADEFDSGLADSERADGTAGIGGTTADRTRATGADRATPTDGSGRGLPDSERPDGTAENGGTAADRTHSAGADRATPADEFDSGLPDSERPDGTAENGGTAADRTHSAGTDRATPAGAHGASRADAGEASRAGAGEASRAGAGEASRADGSGHGLSGMRERAAVVGGTLTAGPTAAGGFGVDAVLPYRASPPQQAATNEPSTEEPSA